MKRITPSTQCWLVGHRILFLSCVVVLFFCSSRLNQPSLPLPFLFGFPSENLSCEWVVAQGVSH